MIALLALLLAVPDAAPPVKDVPVHAGDLPGRPYRVIGPVTAQVRRAPFARDPGLAKIYRELWERARKLGADAVIRADYGEPHVTLISYGSVTATGVAVKFEEGK